MASKRFDVAIIGAGIFGLCAAYRCARAGRSVVVFDKTDGTGGASYGLLGVMSPYAPSGWSEKKAFQFRALVSAEGFWRVIEKEAGLSSGYERVGRRVPLMTPAEKTKAESRSRGARQNWKGGFTLDVVSEALECAPYGVAVDNLSARIAPRRAMAALRRACVQRGVEFENHAEVSLQEARNCALQTIVAAGDDCRGVLPALCPMERGVKGQAALLANADARNAPVLSSAGLYIVDHPGIGTAIGSTSERDWSDPKSTDDALEELIDRARRLRLDLEDAPVAERWAGIRPRGRYPDPVVGPLPEFTDVWLLSGGYGIGFGVAHEIAKELVTLMNGSTPALPQRFSVSAHLDKPG